MGAYLLLLYLNQVNESIKMIIKSILIVDDDIVSHMVAQDAITKFDPSIKILQAEDGQEALEVLDSIDKQPDIILLDINMPRMNGLEFLEVYESRDIKACTIAMYTSSENELDKKAVAKYAFVKDYFVKPISVNDLKNLVTN